MRGFEDSSNPVTLHLRPECLLGSGPFLIDGAAAELTTDGIRADVNGVRYFVPISLVDHVEQVQPDTSGNPPPTVPVIPPEPEGPPPGE